MRRQAFARGKRFGCIRKHAEAAFGYALDRSAFHKVEHRQSRGEARRTGRRQDMV